MNRENLFLLIKSQHSQSQESEALTILISLKVKHNEVFFFPSIVLCVRIQIIKLNQQEFLMWY